MKSTQKTKPIFIYEFDFGGVLEWVAAEHGGDAVKVMLENHELADLPPSRQLSDDEMLKLKHTGLDGEEKDNPKTFRERLDQYIEAGDKFPAHFACTET